MASVECCQEDPYRYRARITACIAPEGRAAGGGLSSRVRASFQTQNRRRPPPSSLSPLLRGNIWKTGASPTPTRACECVGRVDPPPVLRVPGRDPIHAVVLRQR